ncbi:MAG: phosphoadenosine phosphosulfate reductase family protein, partial [Pseudomonadota bacterium]
MSLRELTNQTLEIFEYAVFRQKFGKIATVSSFGAESAVLLHLLSHIDKAAPVLFIDTRMLFQETLDYKTKLTRHLGLSNVQTVSPVPQQIRRNDA